MSLGRLRAWSSLNCSAIQRRGRDLAERIRLSSLSCNLLMKNTKTGMAEREGFEPSVEFPLHTLSKRAPSTTRTSLLEWQTEDLTTGSNRFWKLLSDAKLVPEPVTFEDDDRLGEWGFGITNLIARATPGIDTLKPEDHVAGVRGARVFVLPNPSGRNTNFTYAEMLGAFRSLRRHV